MKTNDKLERIRKRHALFTRFPRPVDSRGSVSRWYYAPDCKVVQYRPRPTTPDAAAHPGESAESASHSQLCAGSPADGRPIDNSGSGNDARITEPLARDILNQWFRFSKAQFQPDDQVYVNSWGYGIVKGIVKGRIQVFAPQFGATGATIYVGYNRLQRVG